MAITTGSSIWYDKGKGIIVGNQVDLDTSPDIRIMLAQSGYTPSVTTHQYVSDITNEVGAGIGYTRYQLMSTSKTEISAGTWAFNSADPTWSASGGDIVAYYWIMYWYNLGVDASSPLICYGLLDTTPASVTATDGGDPLTINVHADGWFKWT